MLHAWVLTPNIHYKMLQVTRSFPLNHCHTSWISRIYTAIGDIEPPEAAMEEREKKKHFAGWTVKGDPSSWSLILITHISPTLITNIWLIYHQYDLGKRNHDQWQWQHGNYETPLESKVVAFVSLRVSLQEASLHLLGHLSFWEQCSKISECILDRTVGPLRSLGLAGRGTGGCDGMSLPSTCPWAVSVLSDLSGTLAWLHWAVKYLGKSFFNIFSHYWWPWEHLSSYPQHKWPMSLEVLMWWACCCCSWCWADWTSCSSWARWWGGPERRRQRHHGSFLNETVLQTPLSDRTSDPNNIIRVLYIFQGIPPKSREKGLVIDQHLRIGFQLSSLISEEGFFDVVFFKWFWILENPGKICSKSFMSLSWTCFSLPLIFVQTLCCFQWGSLHDKCIYKMEFGATTSRSRKS